MRTKAWSWEGAGWTQSLQNVSIRMWATWVERLKSHGGEPQMSVAGLNLDIPSARVHHQRSLNGGVG